MQKTANGAACAMVGQVMKPVRETAHRSMKKKILTAMKMTAFLLLAFCVHVSAKTSSQTITLSGQSIELKKIFAAIEQQTEYVVFYKKELLRQSHPVSLTVHDLPLHAFLEMIQKNQPFHYEIVDKTIILKQKAQSVAELPAAAGTFDYLEAAPAADVQGRVVSKSGVPLAGVNVQVRGTSRAVITDADGKFTIKASETDWLVFSFVGYKKLETEVKKRSSISIELEEEVSALNDVVVTGYQTINRKLFTGATTTISGSEVKQDGIIDVSRMLEGRVAGVSIQNVSGTFGTAPKMRVRGVTSISGENKPLWVIDGIVLEDVVNVTNDQLSSGDALTLIGSSVAGINADDIESFDILKDAAATAIYGARAMNGVVVITTKKGKVGKAVVAYNGNFSTYLKPSYNSLNIMNSRDQMAVYQSMQDKYWLQYASSATRKTGGIFTKMAQLISRPDADGNYAVENTPEGRAAFLQRYAEANTDWFDVLFKNSLMQEHSVSVSSGTDKARHRFSGSFLKDNGWTIADKVNRYTAAMRSSYTLSDKVSIDLMTNGAIREQRTPGALNRTTNLVAGVRNRNFDVNPYSYAVNTSRAMTAYDENGDPEYFTKDYAPFNILNELENNYIEISQLDLKLQAETKYKVVKGLEYNVLGAIRYVKTTREHKITEDANMSKAYRAGADNSVIRAANDFLYDDPDFPELTENEIVLPQGGFYNRVDDYLVNYNARHTVTFNQAFKEKHKLNLMVGQEIKYTNRQNSFSNGYGYQYDKGGVPFTNYKIIKQNIASNVNYYGMGMEYDRYVAMFGNARYSFNDRYIINATMRYDGSNRMGASSTARWLPTWTISGAWNIDEEKFMRNVKVDYFKIRGSYGLTASMGSARNSTVILSNTNTPRRYLEERESQTVLSSLENAQLTWEKQYEGNIGMELGLFKGKLNIVVDFYNRNAFDLISSIETSGIGGEATKTANYADLKSHGYDITIGNRIINTRDFKWKSNITFSYNTNKIVNMQYAPRVIDLVRPEGGAKENMPVRGLYSMQYLGLDHETGLPLVRGLTGHSTTDVYFQSLSTEQLYYEGSVDPTYTGGWANTFSYKNLTLSFLVSYQGGNRIRLNPSFGSSYDDFSAMPKEFLNRWQMPGDELYTNVPVIIDTRTEYTGYPYNNYNYSTIRTVSGAFMRLKNVALSYNMPAGLVKKMGLNNMSFALNASNLWLIYSDKLLNGQDPEFYNSGGVASPLPRQFTLTFKVGI